MQSNCALSLPDERGSGPSRGESLLLAAVMSASAFAGLFGGAAPLRAAEPVSPMAQGLLGLRVSDESEGAARFATPDGALRFTLDRSGSMPLLRFEGQHEVVALTESPGPHGDEFLKDDTGRVVLRVTALGGLIVYADRAGPGAPAALEGPAAPLSAWPPPPPGGLTARLAEIERRAARALGRAIAFEPPPSAALTSGAAVGLTADAAARSAEGLERAKPARLSRVIIQIGAGPAAQLERDALKVTITPRLGYAGRPSARAIAAVLHRPGA